MLPVIYPLLLLSQSFLGAQAAPANLDPTPLSLNLNTIPTSNITTAPSFSDESTLTSLAHLLNSSNPNEVILYRVPNTHTILRIALQSTAIQKPNLGHTILRTQQILSAYIRRHNVGDEPLAREDDPYESDPRYPGCFFGVATFPLGYHHLTYDIVMNVLQGLWLYLYREENFLAAMFEVRDDQFGSVGIGKITPERPGGAVDGEEGR